MKRNKLFTGMKNTKVIFFNGSSSWIPFLFM
jgi:hypothetical protein